MTAVSCEILRASNVRPALQRELDAWKASVWGESGEDGIRWTAPDWYVLVPRESECVSRTGVVSRQITVDGQAVPVAGICEVTTKPTHRGNGYSSQVLRCAADFARNRLRLPFGLLLCEEGMISFYDRLGWRRIEERPVYELPNGEDRIPHLACMILELSDMLWPSGRIDLCGPPW